MRHLKPRVCLLALSVCRMALAAGTDAEVTLPAVLGEHMVLQRNMPVPIWGTAAPGEKIAVSFRGQRKTAAAESSGRWSIRLKPSRPGGPDTLKIVGASPRASYT
jgi:sialate O-acetylesterase